MIKFSAKNRKLKRCSSDVMKEYSKRSEAIRSALPTTCPDRIVLGTRLLELWNSNSYCSKANDVKDGFNNALKINCHSKVFFLVCEREFGLDKSQVSRYMNIVDEFCELVNVVDGLNEYQLTEQWKVFSYSQLSELLSLPKDKREEVSPKWSVKQIREFKKSLRAVATSQQEDTDTDEDFEEPIEYRDLERKDLINLIFVLEYEKSLIKRVLERRGLFYEELIKEESNGE